MPYSSLALRIESSVLPIRLFYDAITFRYRSHTAEHEVETPAFSLFTAWLHIGMLSAMKPVMRKRGEARIGAPDIKCFLPTFRERTLCRPDPPYFHFLTSSRKSYQ